MSITIEEIENMVNSLRRVSHGDEVRTQDILSIKSVCNTIIAYLRQLGWDDPELTLAEKELDKIPQLKYGDIVSFSHRVCINKALMYIDKAIGYLSNLLMVGLYPTPSGGFFYGVKFSPNNQYIALANLTYGSIGDAIYLLRVPSLEVVATVPATTEDPNERYQALGVDFSPDSQYLAVVGEKYSLGGFHRGSFIDTRTVPDLNLIARVGSWENDLYILSRRIDYSPDGDSIVVAVPEIWRGDRSYYGTVIETLTSPDLQTINRREFEGEYWATHAKFSPDEQYIAFANYWGENVWLLDSSDLSTVSTFQGQAPYGCEGLDFSPNGQYLAVGLVDACGFDILKVPDMTRVRMKTKNVWDYPFDVVFSPSGKHILAGFDLSKAFEVIRSPRLSRVGRVEDDVYDGSWAVDISPSGDYLAVTSWTGLILLRDIYGYSF